MVKRASRKSRTTRRLGVELLEDRRVLSMTILSSTAQPTDYDQYLLELINRGRANPTAEASRYEVDLNEGLNPGTISTTPKQPLAFSPALIAAAQGHSQWMIDSNILSHTGQDGSDPKQRMTAAGYSFVTPWGWAENLGWRGTTGTFSTIDYVNQIHRNLFLSPSHRVNQMNGNLREFGAGVVAGEFLHNGTNYNSLLVTEEFAFSGSSVFLTGVVYDDELVTADQFYTPGEGLGGVTVTAVRDSDGQSFWTQTWASGGYTLPLTDGTYTVTASGADFGGALVENNVSVTSQNVKVDFTRADNAVPVVSNLTATPSAVTRPGALTLVAEGVSDPDGQVVEVRFSHDTNGNGVWDPSDELLGADQSASDGWSWSGSTAGWAVGPHRVFARALDNQNAWSEMASTTVIVQNADPLVTSLSASPEVVLESGQIELTADGVSDPDGTVVLVEFYRDGVLLGTDTDGSNGWTWTGSTSGWPAGAHEFSARAWDNDGASSGLVTATATVVAQLPPVDFGVVPVFAKRQRELVISNEGPQPVVIPGFEQGSPFAIHPKEGSGEAEDWIVAPGSSVSFVVSYSPSDEGSHHAVLPLIDDLTGRQVEYHGQAVAGWRNVLNPFDVDGNGAVTPEDVLLLINPISYRGARTLTIRTAEQPGPPWFLDPNGDGRLTPKDVLTVINHLNSGGASEPEGEAERIFSDWDEGLVSRIPAEMAEERLVGSDELPSGWPKRHEQHSTAMARVPDEVAGGISSADSRSVEAWRDRCIDQPVRATNVALDPFELETLLSDLLD